MGPTRLVKDGYGMFMHNTQGSYRRTYTYIPSIHVQSQEAHGISCARNRRLVYGCLVVAYILEPRPSINLETNVNLPVSSGRHLKFSHQTFQLMHFAINRFIYADEFLD